MERSHPVIDKGKEAIPQYEQTPACLQPVFVRSVVQSDLQLPINHRVFFLTAILQRNGASSDKVLMFSSTQGVQLLQKPQGGAVYFGKARCLFLLLLADGRGSASLPGGLQNHETECKLLGSYGMCPQFQTRLCA